jgi:hypothetical protein
VPPAAGGAQSVPQPEAVPEDSKAGSIPK